MRYVKLSLTLPESLFPEIEAILSRQGALSVTAEDAADQPIFEPKPGETVLWQNVHLSALFPIKKNRQKIITKLKSHLDEALLLHVAWEEIAEQAWERSWLQYYQPIQFGNRLWIGSTEHLPPPSVETTLFLDPGLAFGTGSHPTTYLCLERLAALDLHDKTLIDYGCGSGILALAALKRGACHVVGIDIDPQALNASLENAKRNKVNLEDFELGRPDTLHPRPADCVIANILANPLIELADQLIDLIAPSGVLILSGLLEEQADTVKTAYLHRITWLPITIQDGWACLMGYLV